LRTEFQIDLLADGTYHWATRIHDTIRPAGDQLVESYDHSGTWRIRGGRLGIRTTTGYMWRRGHGQSQLDYVPEWNYQHQLEVQGDRLTLLYHPTREQSITPYTRVYHRVIDTGPVPFSHRR
jgi:hypothetical protein